MSSLLADMVDSLDPEPDAATLDPQSGNGFLISIDVGTSGVRAALFDDHGNEIYSTRVSRSIEPQGGFDELNPDQILQEVIESIDQLLTSVVPGNVKLISISTFWHSLLGVDSQGNPATPLLTWADTRATGIAKELQSRFDERAIHLRTGCRFHSSYWSAKLEWLKTERAELFSRSIRWLGIAEYLCGRLFGEMSMSVSMASATGLMNQRTCDWDWGFVDQLGVVRESLPTVRHETFSARLVDEFQLRWPMLSEAQLTTVVGDGAANNIGGGCTTRDRVALMIGTSGAMRVVFAGRPPSQLSPALWSYRVDRRRVVVGGALSDGGGLYQWMMDSLNLDENDDELQEKLAIIEPDGHGLTILPFWSGERSTGWSGDSRGAILGLTQKTTPVEIVRAALESIAYRFALIAHALDGVAPNADVIATGNALRSSPIWSQIVADVLGRRVKFGGNAEASNRGAALLALEAVGKIGNIEEVSEEVDEVFEPDMSRHALYVRAIERQENVRQTFVGRY